MNSGGRGVRPALALLVAIGALVSAACTATPAQHADPPTSAPATSTPLPASLDDVTVVAEVYRTRADAAREGMQLAVRNEGDSPLALASARLESPLLAAPLERADEALVPAGQTRDLPMTLAGPRCGDLDAGPPPPPQAVLVVPLADGSLAELRVPTTDRIGQWAAWLESACFAEAVAARAELAVRAAPSPAAGIIGVDLVVRPHPPAAGRASDVEPLALLEASGTVLLGVVGADGRRAASIPLDAVVGGPGSSTAPLVVPLRFSPNRCDAHAIADDKQGTLFRIGVELDGRRGVVLVAADPATKDALYAAIRSACGARD